MFEIQCNESDKMYVEDTKFTIEKMILLKTDLCYGKMNNVIARCVDENGALNTL